MRRVPDEGPEEFARVVERLRAARLRPEVVLDEVPAPVRIAPHAHAFAAQVTAHDEELATSYTDRVIRLVDGRVAAGGM